RLDSDDLGHQLQERAADPLVEPATSACGQRGICCFLRQSMLERECHFAIASLLMHELQSLQLLQGRRNIDRLIADSAQHAKWEIATDRRRNLQHSTRTR